MGHVVILRQATDAEIMKLNRRTLAEQGGACAACGRELDPEGVSSDDTGPSSRWVLRGRSRIAVMKQGGKDSGMPILCRPCCDQDLVDAAAIEKLLKRLDAGRITEAQYGRKRDGGYRRTPTA